MRPYLDGIKSLLEDEFDINPNNSDLSVKLLSLVQDEERREKIISKISREFETKENLGLFLRNGKSSIDNDEIKSWIYRFIERERESIENFFVDLTPIVSVSSKNPVPDQKESNGYSLDSNISSASEYNSNVRNWFDSGSFEFVGHSRGFKVFHNDGDKRTQIINKVDSNYSANINRLFDKKYLLQVAEIILKNSEEGDFFTIKVPQAIAQSKTIEEQNKYISMMKSALEKVGVPATKIVIDGAKAKDTKSDLEDIKDDNFSSTESNEFKDKYTGSPLKDRFFEYLDRDTKRPSRNPWINFDRLCSIEGVRVLELMRSNEGTSWLPSYTVNEKVSAINEFIDNLTKEDPSQYFGVVAVVTANGDIGFRPDTKPFAMKHVYDIEPTGSQLNFIRSSEFTTSEIEELIIEMDNDSKIELTNANKELKETYQNEQDGSPDNLEEKVKSSSKKKVAEPMPVRNLNSNHKAPSI